MTEKNGNEPAFPQPIDDMGTLTAKTQGMNLRAYFAARAMQGLLSNSVFVSALATATNDPEKAVEAPAKLAVVAADALLAALAAKEAEVKK